MGKGDRARPCDQKKIDEFYDRAMPRPKREPYVPPPLKCTCGSVNPGAHDRNCPLFVFRGWASL